MPITINGVTLKNITYNGQKVKKWNHNGVKVYSAGNIVTYRVDTNVVYTEEVDEGASCLSPKTFTPVKSGWTFLGWRIDATASATVLTSKVMGDTPITLYAVFTTEVTVGYYNGTPPIKTQTKMRYYNNGNVANPSFTLAQAALSGWTARGWSTGTSADASITYGNGVTFSRDSNITLYGMYYKTVTVSYNGNGNTSGSTAAQTGTRYYNSNGRNLNPTFTLNANGFARTNSTWLAWAIGSTSGTQYVAGAIVTLSESTIFYAKWQCVKAVAVNIYRQYYEQGDGWYTQTVTSSAVSNVSVVGTLTSDANDTQTDDGRCDTTLYINDTQLACLSVNDNVENLSVKKSNLGAFSGVIIKILVHPHSTDRGRGSFNGTVTITTIV